MLWIAYEEEYEDRRLIGVFDEEELAIGAVREFHKRNAARRNPVPTLKVSRDYMHEGDVHLYTDGGRSFICLPCKLNEILWAHY